MGNLISNLNQWIDFHNESKDLGKIYTNMESNNIPEEAIDLWLSSKP